MPSKKQKQKKQTHFSEHQVVIPLRHALQLEMTYVLNQFNFKLTYITLF